jgi:hypothetical protein
MHSPTVEPDGSHPSASGADNSEVKAVFHNSVAAVIAFISTVPVPRGLKQEPGAPLGFIDPIFQ